MNINLTSKEIEKYNNEIKAYCAMKDFEEELNDNHSITVDEFMINEGVEYLYKRAIKNELNISDDLETCMLDGCHFEGFQYRIKSINRLREKLLADTKKIYFGDYVKATNHLYDALRYTIILPYENHFTYLNVFLTELLDMKYTLVRIKNRWSEDYCKGVTVVLKTAQGVPVEIQFHTQENYDVKETYTRDPYKVFRDVNAPVELRVKANRLRAYYHSRVRMPEGALDYQFRRQSISDLIEPKTV